MNNKREMGFSLDGIINPSQFLVLNEISKPRNKKKGPIFLPWPQRRRGRRRCAAAAAATWPTTPATSTSTGPSGVRSTTAEPALRQRSKINTKFPRIQYNQLKLGQIKQSTLHRFEKSHVSHENLRKWLWLSYGTK